jgi:hypothetical protein
MKLPVSPRISRRQLAAAVLAPAPMLGQATPATADELAAARQRVQSNADRLRKFKIPIATEPSFTFRP